MTSANTESKLDADQQKRGRVGRRLKPSDMPGDHAVSLSAYVSGGTDKFLADGRADLPRQRLQGFDVQYTTIIDYIVRITHRIWEEKDIGYIYDCYSHDARVSDDYGLQLGRDKIVADTTHTLSAFPDVRMVADEIIWAGNDDVGFRTSHRVNIVGHNTGFSKYGPPTSKRISVWCIANCVSLANEIFEEHVLYNTGSIIRQLGLDLMATTRLLAESLVPLSAIDTLGSEPRRQIGQGKPEMMVVPDLMDAMDVEGFEHALYQNIWNRRMLRLIPQLYSDTLIFNGPTDRKLTGAAAYQAFVLSMLSMFPDLAITVQEVYWMGNCAEGVLATVRWNANGTHRGPGIYGAPSLRAVRFWGITQHRFVAGKIVEEWLLFNEVDLLMQTLRSTTASASAG
jgi:predicted ester cyclase